jgi:hypothetical protein
MLDPAEGSRLEPVTVLERALGTSLVAVIGVRHGANGKATLQLFDPRGNSVGYAKLAWNEATSAYVRAEGEALRSVVLASSGVKVPQVLAEGVVGGDLPFLVTKPLPRGARRLRAEDLSLSILAGLFPVLRRDRPAMTGQFQRVVARLRSAQQSVMRDDELYAAATELVDRLIATDVEVPVLARWHGDLVPWNAAREDDGTIWLWDWESSEPDAVAGLDVLHWAVHSSGSSWDGEAHALHDVVTSAVLPLQSLGLGPRGRASVAGTYALTVAERHWSLAVAHGTWARNRVGREATLRLLAAGGDLLTAGTRELRT